MNQFLYSFYTVFSKKQVADMYLTDDILQIIAKFFISRTKIRFAHLRTIFWNFLIGNLQHFQHMRRNSNSSHRWITLCGARIIRVFLFFFMEENPRKWKFIVLMQIMQFHVMNKKNLCQNEAAAGTSFYHSQ
ncbi:hypothetical protein CLIB1423_22S00452 [[Candida] railenensis]|uniref:Uncharacterized protein n=1 Tax=[Candida] railenensis TaxID=45579 RepID=A0A9P0W0K2_9ASCO|nr:hypothetical protein CLIB1423_22S00452 [[Candida] railenensis]